MYLPFMLLLLPFMWEWQVAVADCGKACYDYEGTYLEPCRNRTGNGNERGDGEGRAVALLTCDEDEVFSGSRTFYELPDGATDIIITNISLSGLDHFVIGRLICSNDSECFTMTLTSDANASILIRPKTSSFKIAFFGIQIEFATLTFRVVCDRDCAKMKMRQNGGLMKRIVDGKEAVAHEFPFIVRLSIFYSTHNDPNDYKNCNTNGWVSYTDTKINCCNNSPLEAYRCGGSILNKDWIMSAKHCFDKTETLNNKLFYLVGVLVYAGDHNTEVNETNKQTLHWVTTNQIEIHETADLALLKVVPEITLVKGCRYPICLPPPYMDRLPFLDGCAVEAAGWGRTKTKSLSDVLIKGDFMVVTNAACKTKYAKKSKVITNKMICTDHDQTISCKGDSGGPVFCKSWSKHYYQIGVISFGEPETTDPFVWDNEFPDVNVRVTKFVDWIKGIVGNVP